MKAYLESQDAASPELAQRGGETARPSDEKPHPELGKQGVLEPVRDGAGVRRDARSLRKRSRRGVHITYPDLLEYALENKVVVAAPASFLALLRVVAYGWMQIELESERRRDSCIGKGAPRSARSVCGPSQSPRGVAERCGRSVQRCRRFVRTPRPSRGSPSSGARGVQCSADRSVWYRRNGASRSRYRKRTKGVTDG